MKSNSVVLCCNEDLFADLGESKTRVVIVLYLLYMSNVDHSITIKIFQKQLGFVPLCGLFTSFFFFLFFFLSHLLFHFDIYFWVEKFSHPYNEMKCNILSVMGYTTSPSLSQATKWSRRFFKKKKSKYSLMTSILILAIITVCNVHILWAEDVWNNKYIKWVLTASFNAKSQTIKKKKEKKP